MVKSEKTENYKSDVECETIIYKRSPENTLKKKYHYVSPNRNGKLLTHK